MYVPNTDADAEMRRLEREAESELREIEDMLGVLSDEREEEDIVVPVDGTTTEPVNTVVPVDGTTTEPVVTMVRVDDATTNTKKPVDTVVPTDGTTKPVGGAIDNTKPMVPVDGATKPVNGNTTDTTKAVVTVVPVGGTKPAEDNTRPMDTTVSVSGTINSTKPVNTAESLDGAIDTVLSEMCEIEGNLSLTLSTHTWIEGNSFWHVHV